MIVATLAEQGQWPNAGVLASSVKRFYPDAHTVLCMIGEYGISYQTADFDEVLIISASMGEEQTEAAIPAYKAYLIKYLLEAYSGQPIIYFDPEMRIYGPLEELLQLQQAHDIVAVPYYIEPQDDEDNEIECLRNGFLYAGFLAIRPTENASKFIHWWLNRIVRASFGSQKDALSDQKWLSLGLTTFGIRILKHEAYLLAAWNMHERKRQLQLDEGGYVVNGSRLRIAYFGNENGQLERKLVAYAGQPCESLVHAYWNECAVYEMHGKKGRANS